MKKMLLPAVLALSLSGIQIVYAESCMEPVEVSLPDGATAVSEVMLASQKGVKKYIADGEAFLACLEELEKANAKTLTDEGRKANVERYNAVVDRMQLLAQNFNEQLKAYKAAQAEQ